ncbi:MAG: STAS/SEC14 domain-containing protein [Gemmatimonadaceae bacterium]|nr:STAS/SEC14 domain-containing protein [Gemmatimonadaceae bacterium]
MSLAGTIVQPMPLSYVVSDAEQLVRVVASGSVTSDDLPRMTSSLIADSNILPGTRFLVEAANVDPDLTFTDLRNAAVALRSLNEKSVADMAIVTDTTHLYALAQVFAVLAPASTVAIKVFRNGDEAMAWLESQRTAS